VPGRIAAIWPTAEKPRRRLPSAPVTLAARSAVAAALLACVAAGALEVLVMDRVGVAAGLALPVGAAAAATIGRRPMLGVQLGVLAVPLEFFSLRIGGETGLSPTEMLLLVSAGAALVQWSLTVARPQVPPVLRAATATCVLIAVGYLAAEDKLIVTKILVMWSAFMVVAVLVANAEERDVARLMACVAIAGGIAGLVAVAGGANQSLVEGGLIATNRAQASFAQPNVLGFFLVLAIPTAVVLAVRGRPATRAFMAVMAAGAFWGLMLSLSRTSLIGTFLALGVLLLWPAFRRWAIVGLAALALFALFNVQALERSQQISVVTQRLATLGRATTVEADPRLQMWRTTPKIIAAHPLLGVGAGNYSVAAKRYALLDQNDLPFDHAHDVPLTIGAELGLPGLAVLAWFVVALGALVLRAIDLRGDPVRGALLLALAATMVGVAPIALADYPPRTNAIAATFIIEVGALAALLRHARRAATPRAPSAPR
jgi:putative inorganic carbon (HCO3(-)) transporter